MHPQIPIVIIFVISLQSIRCADYADSSNETQQVYTLNDIYNEKSGTANSRYFERCYGVYGCFSVKYPWQSEQRALSVYPFSPSIIDVKFPVFTHSTRSSPTLININDPSNINSLNINKTHKLYVIAHGFLEHGNSPWLIRIMNEILDFDNQATVIIVDWRKGSAPPYFQAVANIRVVGAVEAHMIMGVALELELKNLDNFHLIGHSLGSHVSGYAGYHLQRDFGLKAGRITGLDPAKPYFEFTPPIVRLDPLDAKYVDILHTDSATFQEKSFGLKQRIGHVDFYPNGGEQQPVCLGKYLDVSCNHKNAVELYIESINSKCPFMAISCESYDQFLNGTCSKCNENGNACVRFGFHSQNSYKQIFKDGEIHHRNFYLLTSSTPPFCKVHYHITFKISNMTVNGGDVGTLAARLISSDGRNSEKIQITKSEMEFKAGNSYSFLVTSHDIGETMETVKVLYNYNLGLLRLKMPEIFIDFIKVHSLEYENTFKMCLKNGESLVIGYVAEFKKEYCV